MDRRYKNRKSQTNLYKKNYTTICKNYERKTKDAYVDEK